MSGSSGMNVSSDSGGISFTATGNISNKLASYAQNMGEAVSKALRLSGGKLLGKSVDLTPVDTGELRARAFVSNVYACNTDKTIVVGYEKTGQSFPLLTDGSKNKYSVYVHERQDLHHEVGQAKFLETAAKEFEDDYRKALVATLKKVKP